MFSKLISLFQVSRPVQCGLASLLGALLGCAGYSLVLHPQPSAAEKPRLVRCTGVEIVNEYGVRLGYLGAAGRAKSGMLTFFDSRGVKRVELGLLANSPKLTFNDERGNELVTMEMLEDGRPKLFMRDRDLLDRVLLGVNEPDARLPNERMSAWVLQFRGDRGPLATIGMRPEKGGAIAVRDVEGHQWWAPLAKGSGQHAEERR